MRYLGDATSAAATKAGEALVAQINSALSQVMDICSKWDLDMVVQLKRMESEEQYSIIVSTHPKAMFRGWVDMRKGVSVPLNQISRMDRYGLTSVCVIPRDYELKELCHCK